MGLKGLPGPQGPQGGGVAVQANPLQMGPSEEGEHLGPGPGGLEAPPREARAGGVDVEKVRGLLGEDEFLGGQALQGGGQGLGSRLIAFTEERIFRDHPNVFLCVSGFNHAARRLYERLGYTCIGELKDYVVQDQSEWLYRKTRGPLESAPTRGVSVP